MNIEKRCELQKKQIERLESKVAELKQELEYQNEEFKRTHRLNKDLEKLKENWSDEIKQLRDMQVEYGVLISQLKILTKQNK